MLDERTSVERDARFRFVNCPGSIRSRSLTIIGSASILAKMRDRRFAGRDRHGGARRTRDENGRKMLRGVGRKGGGERRRRTGEIEGNGPRRSQQPILDLFPWTLRNMRASLVSSVIADPYYKYRGRIMSGHSC